MHTTLKGILLNAVLLLCGIALPLSAIADADNNKIGMVIMHGKGGSPTGLVSGLASALDAQGYLVANLEMTWSGKRNYDVDVDAAAQEVEAALSSLRSQGAKKLFVAGHSQGGLFTFYFGNKHVVDGLIAIAPGGNVANKIFRDNLGSFVAKARTLVAEGKADEVTSLADFESSTGSFPVNTTPSKYLSWFEPEGAMNQLTAIRKVNPANPVLYIAPTRDYPGLLKVKQEMFGALPANSLSRLYEPDANHKNVPAASVSEIISWTTAIANGR